MGGSSKKVTVGYKYYLGLHMILSHGPVDRLLRIRVDEKNAWLGEQEGDGQVYIDKLSLFGGESREGGIQGYVDFETGGPAQGQNSYLVSKVDSDTPSFRGVVGMVLRQVYVGLNPYLKKWDFRISRIHTRQNGIAQWYDAKAEIVGTNNISEQLGPTSDGWKYLQVALSDSNDYSSPSFDDSGWSTGQSPFAFPAGHPYSSSSGFPAISNTTWSLNTKIWIRRTFTLSALSTFTLTLFVDNLASVWVNGVKLLDRAGTITTPSGPAFTHTIVVSSDILNVGSNVLVCEAEDYGSYSYAAFKLDVSGVPQYDMNPAHIIRECLTDPDWGMGYQEADVDDTSFTAAADTLFDENMGISLLWDRQTAIEGFIQEILKHIDAALYVDRVTGTFVLKLIRDDYVLGDLVLLDESNIAKIDNYQKTAFGELTNSVTVNYWDSQTSNTASLTIQDIALAQMQGAVINTTIQYPGFTNANIASRAATRDLKTLSVPLVSCTIYTNRDGADLNIGDAFKLSWAEFGISELVMRVNAIAFGDGKRNQVRITASQDVYSLPTAAFIPASPVIDQTTVTPVAVTHRAVFEVPYLELVQGYGQTDIDAILAADPLAGYVGAGGIRPLSGAINARMLTDPGTGYTEAGAMEFSPGATLAEDIGYTDTTFDIENAQDIDVVELGTWAQIDDELVAIVAISETSVTVERGVLDTVPAQHSTGAALICWDVYGQGDPTQYVSGETIDVRLLTVTGSGELDTSLAPEDSVLLAARAIRPYPPGNFRINSVGFPTYMEGAAAFSWVHRDRTQQTGESLIGHTEGSVGPEAGTTYTLELENESGNLVRTYSGLTGLSQSWTTETDDSGTYAEGSQVYEYEPFHTAIPGSFATFYQQSGTPSVAFYAKQGAALITVGTAAQTYWEIDSWPFLYSGEFEAELEMIADSNGAKHFGIWLVDEAGDPVGYRFDHNLSTSPIWECRRYNTAGSFSSTKISGSLLATPSVSLNTRYRMKVTWDGDTGLFAFYVDGVKVFELTDTTHKRLRPAVFAYQNQVLVHEVRLLANQVIDRLNNQFNVKASSVVATRASWQPVDFLATRVGYGYSYGESYGGI